MKERRKDGEPWADWVRRQQVLAAWREGARRRREAMEAAERATARGFPDLCSAEHEMAMGRWPR